MTDTERMQHFMVSGALLLSAAALLVWLAVTG